MDWIILNNGVQPWCAIRVVCFWCWCLVLPWFWIVNEHVWIAVTINCICWTLCTVQNYEENRPIPVLVTSFQQCLANCVITLRNVLWDLNKYDKCQHCSISCKIICLFKRCSGIFFSVVVDCKSLQSQVQQVIRLDVRLCTYSQLWLIKLWQYRWKFLFHLKRRCT